MMNKPVYVTLLVTLCMVLGCSTKEEKIFKEAYKKDIVANHALQKTEKIQLYKQEDNSTKVLITATYVMPKELKSKKNERFIVGMYIEDNGEDEENSISINDVSLQLNGKKAKHIQKLKKKSALLKEIPFISTWTHFYVLDFPHVEKKTLNLSVNMPYLGKKDVMFSKVAKYTLP